MKSRGEGATLNGFLDKGSRLKGELSFEETFGSTAVLRASSRRAAS
jgi:hypothetical protein